MGSLNFCNCNQQKDSHEMDLNAEKENGGLIQQKASEVCYQKHNCIGFKGKHKSDGDIKILGNRLESFLKMPEDNNWEDDGNYDTCKETHHAYVTNKSGHNSNLKNHFQSKHNENFKANATKTASEPAEKAKSPVNQQKMLSFGVSSFEVKEDTSKQKSKQNSQTSFNLNFNKRSDDDNKTEDQTGILNKLKDISEIEDKDTAFIITSRRSEEASRLQIFGSVKKSEDFNLSDLREKSIVVHSNDRYSVVNKKREAKSFKDEGITVNFDEEEPEFGIESKINNNKSYDGVRKAEENYTQTEIEEKKRKKRLQLIQSININSFIPQNRILKASNCEVLFLSELQRLINKQITSHSSCLYSTRLCLITKTEFRYYKSKEQYLTMQKPLRVIPFSSISEVNFAKSSKQNTLDHFYIKLHEDTYTENKPIVGRKNDIEFELTHTNINNRSNYIEKCENKEGLLIFSSNKADLISKWVSVLNYFIQ